MTTIFVSPNGSDSNDGSSSSPLGTLPVGRDHARALRKEGGQVTVELMPGIHRLTEALVLRSEDSHVIWKGSSEGETVLSSGVPVRNWEKVEDHPDLPEICKGKVWMAQLPSDTAVNMVYTSQGKLPRAFGKAIVPVRLPDLGETVACYGPSGPVHDGEQVVFDDGTRMFHDRFGFSEGAIPEVSDLHEAEVHFIPRMQWCMNVLQVDRVDFEENAVYLENPCTYPIGVPACAPDGSIQFSNTLSVLSPGTWVYHASTARLYLCTEGDAPGDDIEVGSLTEYIRVEGECDPQGAQSRVEGVRFENLTFTRSHRFDFHGLTGKGIQHDWEMHDAPSAMLRFRHTTGCEVLDCTFTEAGSTGLRFDLACSENRVSGSTFSHLGACGVVLCGYGPSRHYLSRTNEVVDNHFHHLGESYWHCPAIFVWQSGDNRVARNYIHDLPYSGIVCSGRAVYDREGKGECSGTIDWEAVDDQAGRHYIHTHWRYGGLPNWWMREPLLHARENLIEYNEIRDVMQVMGDGNGIYVSGGGGGNVVRYNVVGPCPSPHMAEAIRCDDDQHHTIIHANLVHAQGGRATGITLKGVNRVTNNILALPSTIPERGLLSLETGPLNGAVIKRNLFLTSDPAQKFVSEIRIHGKGRKARTKDADCDKNLYWCTGDAEAGSRWLAEQHSFGIELESLACDPGLVDPENGDYNVKEGAVVLKTGFQPLPLDKMFAGKVWA